MDKQNKMLLSRLPKSICPVIDPLEGVVELEYLGDFCYQVDGETLKSIVAGDSLFRLGDLEHENNMDMDANIDDGNQSYDYDYEDKKKVDNGDDNVNDQISDDKKTKLMIDMLRRMTITMLYGGDIMVVTMSVLFWRLSTISEEVVLGGRLWSRTRRLNRSNLIIWKLSKNMSISI